MCSNTEKADRVADTARVAAKTAGSLPAESADKDKTVADFAATLAQQQQL